VTRLTARWGVIGLVVAGVVVAVAGRGPRRLTAARPDPSLALTARAAVPPPVQDILRRACLDCHSEETRWPWYSRVPPVSWLVAHDVEAGRGQINFSQWGGYNPFDRADMLDKVCDQATRGRMPRWPYRLLHADARLSDADVAALCTWAHAEGDRLVQGGT
jgi:hypothetical protein